MTGQSSRWLICQIAYSSGSFAPTTPFYASFAPTRDLIEKFRLSFSPIKNDRRFQIRYFCVSFSISYQSLIRHNSTNFHSRLDLFSINHHVNRLTYMRIERAVIENPYINYFAIMMVDHEPRFCRSNSRIHSGLICCQSINQLNISLFD